MMTVIRRWHGNHGFSRLQSSSLSCYSSSVADSTRKVQQLAPGLFVIKNALTQNEQRELTLYTLALGEDSQNGFYKSAEGGQRILNSQPNRGRMYRRMDDFPQLASICARTLALATEIDHSLPPANPTHAIALYYQMLTSPPTHGYIPWHRDNGKNDGVDEYPVISFSLGISCDFLISHQKPSIAKNHPLEDPQNLDHRILFESGDAVIFGGPSRLVWHAIYAMHPHTSLPCVPLNGGRLNITCRYTPELLGREHEFATQSAEDLKKLKPEQNPFYRLS